MLALRHPALALPEARHGLIVVLVVRVALFSALIFGLNGLIDLGTAPAALSLGATLGIIGAAALAFTPLRTLGFIGVLAGVWAVHTIFFNLMGVIGAAVTPGRFTLLNWRTHADLALLCGAVGAITTWGFWRFRHVMTLEVLALGGAAIYLFSGHRNFRFDTPANTPQIINSLAWDFGVDHLTMLVVVGIGVALLIVLYGFFSTVPSKPSPALGLVQTHPGRRDTIAGSALALFLGLSLYIAGDAIYRYYDELARERTLNGVGLSSNEGLSPLSFQSALGSTNQPAALVRLESDYGPNPFTPMLYLRESALSEFNGHEIVQAKRTYDRDVSMTTPREAYAADEDGALSTRMPVGQSVYLLADHNLAFALDYPVSITPLSVQGNKRFRAAYRAQSLAPTFKLEEMRDLEAGDPRWSAETRAHYLAPHGDPRYGELAVEITKDAIMPIEKAAAIVQYLSKKAIYTLTPNHKVEPKADPVAPFLFGDMRGYCVHFAHAVTYMLRSLGIPARIGTGYLTDLSQAKDGHILLRMSDRHAWAEVYIVGFGWVPFDVQPEQVESHGDTQVDMKLLEELMASLEPGEEILPKDAAKDEAGMEEPGLFDRVPPSIALWLALGLLVFAAGVKAFLRFGWLLPGTPRTQLVRAARASFSTLYDLGFRRRLGETRLEFRDRLSREFNASPLEIVAPFTAAVYQRGGAVDGDLIRSIHQRDRAALRTLPLWRRVVGFLNPASVAAALSGGRW